MAAPVVGVLVDPQWSARFPAFDALLRWAGATSPTKVATWTVAALAAAYTARTATAVLLAYAETHFAFTTQADTSSRLYAAYLRQPWTFHLQRNSAELVRNATSEPQLFAMYLLAVLHLAAECLVVAALAIVLLVMEPLGALFAIVSMAGAAGLFQLASRQRMQAWGVQRQELEGGRLKQLQHGFGGAKEVMLLGRERHFERLFTTLTRAYTRTLQRQQFVSQLPRLWLEAVTVLGLLSLVLFLASREAAFATALPSLGLFAAAAFRLLPSVNRIVMAIHTMRFRAPSVHLLHRELGLQHRSSADDVHRDRLSFSRLTLDRVSYRYPDACTNVLSDITFSVDSGTVVGFIGPSGAGKSTLVDVILGLLPSTSGTVMVNSTDIYKQLRAWQNSIGYVPQSIYLMDDTIRRNVAFGLRNNEIDDNHVWRALRDASIDGFVRGLPQGLDTVTGERGVWLSGGQRQRIGIARALYHDPDVLVLDEATSALDATTEEEVLQSVIALRGRKTVLLIAHRPTTIAHCDHVFHVRHGTI